MDTTVDKVERLTRYLKEQHREFDPVIDSAFDMLIERERQFFLKQRTELRTKLDQLENQYALESSDFYEKFERGEMSNNIDFVNWSNSWETYQTVLESLKMLDPKPISSKTEQRITT